MRSPTCACPGRARFYEIAQLATNLQRANEKARNLIAEGQRIQAERELFRQRAAALIQGYRTKDLTFRTFRNEALEQYRSLFDLASRYTYLAAKSYDYETGLLGSTTGQDAINAIVASRALGDLTGGTPQATVSTTATPVSPARWRASRPTGPSPRAASASTTPIPTARSSRSAANSSASSTIRRAPMTTPRGSRPSSSTS
jgi:hypothetical protein